MNISASPTSKTLVIATLVVEGFHHWPDAPRVVRYLAKKHRHLFKLRAEWLVQHGDRAVEFHIARLWLRKAVAHVAGDESFVEPLNFGSMSCEMIAQYVNDELVALKLPACSAIEVWEDEENGGRVEFLPQ